MRGTEGGVASASPTASSSAEADAQGAMPGVYRVEVDRKPPLSSLKNMPDQLGLTIDKDGLYYALPTHVQAWRWDALARIYEDDSEGNLSLQMSTGDNPGDEAIVVPIRRASSSAAARGDWEPELALRPQEVQIIIKAAGLTLEGGAYIRSPGSPAGPRPKSRQHFPFTRPAPSSLTVSNAELAKLPGNLGFFILPEGVVLSTPTAISSIRWGKFKELKAEEQPGCSMYLADQEDGTPGDYHAIYVEGPGPDPLGYYLDDKDFFAAVKLLKPRKAPAKGHSFPLYSKRADTGPRMVESPGPDPFVPIQTSPSQVSWPGASLRDCKPLRTGLYLLPCGLLQVKRNAIFHAAWSQFKTCGIQADGSFSSEVGQVTLHLQPQNAREAPSLRAVSQEILSIIGLQRVPSSSYPFYNDLNGPVRKPPQTARFYPDSESRGDWRGVSCQRLGSEPLADGIHLTQDGFLLVRGASLESVLWDDFRELGSKDEHRDNFFIVTNNDRFKMPILSYNLPPRLIADVIKALPEFWVPGEATDQGTTAGKARPPAERPAQMRSFLLKDYPASEY